MSGHGAPETQPIDAAGLRVVIVAGIQHVVGCNMIERGPQDEALERDDDVQDVILWPPRRN